MSKVFVISDTWFNRPMEDDPNVNVIDHNDHLIMVWNEIVNPEDKVFVLGGFGISDLYHIVVRLNGEIHFLNNYFNENERVFIDELIQFVNNSADESLRERIIFENHQVMSFPDFDCFISYFPLMDWPGKNTGTFCFHGVNDYIDVIGHNISSTASKWEGVPVDIEDIEKSITTFQNQT